ncbi:ubiquitin-like domain-containing protein [Saxibacter everestensis]|uniref:Ubiquitin-like domain-containing protein n=1 Tax=Saxibacter everestensis TaxID=2909229 RepID=A0ABY8QV16_9MICO|nr:ubiquitin-like domain-containing protein [Brevibacteriaceae bacterium ZFBP1038]
MSSRKFMIGAQTLVIGALVAGSLAFIVFNKPVSVSVDGSSEQVRTFGRSVSDVLEAEGVAVGAHDSVSPSLQTKIDRNSEIVVRHGRQVSLAVDGRQQKIWTTALTVDEALADAGIDAEGAELSASRSSAIGRQGTSVQVTTAKEARVLVDGKSVPVSTTAATVGEALDDAKVKLDDDDVTSVPASAPVVPGLTVSVLRVTTEEVTEKETVKHETETKKDKEKDEGEKAVTQKGKDGEKTVTYKTRSVDGETVEKTKVGEEVTTKPQKEIVTVGTKKEEFPSKTGTKADSLNWKALAKCESTNNPKAVNSNGHYGLYQFSLSTWQKVGGSGNPIDASEAEQTYRAKLLYDKAGAGQWSCGHYLFT